MDLASAKKAIRQGAVAGFISAGITLIIVSIAVLGHGAGVLQTWNDPINFLDVVLILGLAFGVLRRSRTSAILLLLYFILAKILLFNEGGGGRGGAIVMAIIFIYFFGRAVLGTFAYHRIRREQDAEYTPIRKWMYFVWIPVGLIGALLAGFAVLGSFVPTSTVIAGDELSHGDLELLRAEGIIEPHEYVILFYSTGLFSIREDGNLITSKRVISYAEYENEMWVASAPFEEIETVSIEESGGFFSDTIILVTLTDGQSFRLYATTERDGDKRFLDTLVQHIK